MHTGRNFLIASLALGMTLSSFKHLGPDSVLDNGFSFRKLPNTAFKVGEKLTFRAHYGLINAARITMSVDPVMQQIGTRKAFLVRTEGETLKSFDWMYKVRDKFDSYLDEESLAPLRYSMSKRENKYTASDAVIYYHEQKKLRNLKGELAMPVYTQDIASAIYYARNLDFSTAKLNQSFPVDVYMDNKVYNLQFKFIGRETLNTDIGKVRCIKLRPKLVVDRVFKDDDDMTIWVSDDKNKIPIRVESAIQVGSVKVDITAYENLKNSFDALLK
ncbi:MAG: DUF3108 domain-containing protein [Bacteroidetes bacterium]|nr:DUF3108 domain-containing protein [Bacteroidota bacterium]